MKKLIMALALIAGTALVGGSPAVAATPTDSLTKAEAKVDRLGGKNRYETAVAVSKAQFANSGAADAVVGKAKAGAVVIAGGMSFPDSLVGTPLAHAMKAPMLLTAGDSLPDATKAELKRVLAADKGRTVYLLGGTAVTPKSVADEITELGYEVERFGGDNRYETATKVAGALGNPGTVMLAGGTLFPDALSAGIAAATNDGVVLLTKGDKQADETRAYLTKYGKRVYTIGGPASRAHPGQNAVAGATRYSTATAVAKQFFAKPNGVGIASGEMFPDATSSGALLAREGVPLVLARADELTDESTAYLKTVKSSVKTVHLFGGKTALSFKVTREVRNALK